MEKCLMGGEKFSLPRKKDWTSGKYQVGVFIRTPDGSVIYLTADKPSRSTVELAWAILKDHEYTPSEASMVNDSEVWVHEKKSKAP
jgi:hypothetical protein